MSIPTSIFAHYIQKGDKWEPLLSKSHALFKAIIEDNYVEVQKEVQSDPGSVQALYDILYWGHNNTTTTTTTTIIDNNIENNNILTPSVSVKQRTLLMLAAMHGCLSVVTTLIVNGAVPRQLSPDGLSAYQIVEDNQDGKNASMILAYLKESEGHNVNNKDFVTEKKNNLKSKNLDDSELRQEEFCSNEFRMFCFKVIKCPKQKTHNWHTCPFAHPTENARRRDPNKFKYCSVPCPNYKNGFCIKGDDCPYAHGIYESWLHPSRYRTQLCKDGNKCKRGICFFAHNMDEIRAPTHNWIPQAEELKNAKKQIVIPIKENGYQVLEDLIQSTNINKNEQEKKEDSNKSETLNTQNINISNIVMPRMSNAFAKKHGLDPKNDPKQNMKVIMDAGAICIKYLGPKIIKNQNSNNILKSDNILDNLNDSFKQDNSYLEKKLKSKLIELSKDISAYECILDAFSSKTMLK